MQTTANLDILASMATPAVLLLANAMLILSTNQRLQSVLQRVSEAEAALRSGADPLAARDPDLARRLLRRHARRARAAHRALLCFYGSAAAFVAVVVLIGLAGIDIPLALALALVFAFIGSALLVCGTGLLVTETWIGIHATDHLFAALLELCDAGSESGEEGIPGK